MKEILMGSMGGQRVAQSIADFLQGSTRTGLYPIVAYGLDTQAEEMIVLTSSIQNLSLAMNKFERSTDHRYDLSCSFDRALLDNAYHNNPNLLYRKSCRISGMAEMPLPAIREIVRAYGAPFHSQKAFGLVDIVGFSKLSHPGQLAELYALNSLVNSSIRRTHKFCEKLGVSTEFRKTSTGDGYYFWHDGTGGASDIATFMLLLCIMSGSENIRNETFPFQLRAAFAIDSVFVIYDDLDTENMVSCASNAVGAATNCAARLCSAAKPSQILVGDFTRHGHAGEEMTPHTLVTTANELFQEEAFSASISAFPNEKLRVVDKHGKNWYCYNFAGEIPDVHSKAGNKHNIGLKTAVAKDINTVQFYTEPDEGSAILT